MMHTLFSNRACGILYRFFRRYGGRYLLPANVCPVVPLTMKLAGVEFKFVDIDSLTLCIDEKVCLNLVGKGSFSGVVFVHTYGTQYNPQPFFQQIRQVDPSFIIIDDKCLCFPDFTMRQTEADLTIFSTGYAKNVDLGKGGFGFIKDDFELSWEPLSYEGSDISTVYKEMIANKWKVEKIPSGWLDAEVSLSYNGEYCQRVEMEAERAREHKRIINAVYKEYLIGIKSLSDEFNQWRYNILVDNKSEVLKYIFDKGFFASSHYRPSSCLFVDEQFPNALGLYEQVINLFNDKYMDVQSAIKLALLVRDMAKSHI